MNRQTTTETQTGEVPACWREATFWLVVLAWCGLFALRLTTLTLRGEETRRALVAREMIESGDWFVPRQQGVPFADRPPLAEWMIALSSLLCGEMTTAAVRLPATLGVLLAAVMIYRFTRRFLSAAGAAAAALVFLSSIQVLQLGRLAESEGVFVGAVTAALFGWHLGYRSDRPAWQNWCLTYVGVAAAALTKGPQGAVYVCGAIGLYLLARRDWRYLFAPGHFWGLTVFALLFGGWYVGCGLHEDFATARGTVFAMVNMRLANRGSLPVHMLRYPWEVLAALLPWSPFLARYAWPGFRAELGPARDGVLFCVAAVAASFPSVWFIYGALNRHYFSMYPCFAVLIGVVLDRTFAAAVDSSLAGGWRWFVRAVAVVALGGTAVVIAAPWLAAAWARPLVQPAWFVACMAPIMAAIAFALLGRRVPIATSWSPERRRFVGFLGVVGLLGTAYVGVSINTLASLANDVREPTLAAKRLLPPGAQLVSFDLPEHVFLYHFGDPVRRLPWPAPNAPAPEGVEYFVYSNNGMPAFEPGFAWERVAVVSCDRNRKAMPERMAIVGRVVRPTVAAAASPSAVRR